MTIQLSHSVRRKIEDSAIQNGLVQSLGSAASAVSSRYRRLGEETGADLQIKSREEALAYLVGRLPATYAVNGRVLSEIFKYIPDFMPSCILDVGAGPGTASYAASRYIGGEAAYTLLEPNRFLRDAGAEFICPEIGPNVSWIGQDIRSYRHDGQAFDLVCASYVLNELGPAEDLKDIVGALWASCSGVMIVIETGTPHGFSVVHRVRELLTQQAGAHLLGPCPQVGTCPLAEHSGRWCHFSVRAERSRFQITLKDGATLGYEDEKFSWVAFSRFPVSLPSYRVIGHPSKGKVIDVQVCSKAGDAETLRVAKSSPLYKSVRKVEWGDGIYE